MKKTFIALLLCLGSLSAGAALDPELVRQLAAEGSGDKVTAIRQIAQNADRPAKFCCSLANASGTGNVIIDRAVRKVHADDVNAGFNQVFKHFRC